MNLQRVKSSYIWSDRAKPQQPLLTIADVAEHYQLQPATVRKMVRDGALDALQIGRDYRVTWDSV